MDEQGKIKFTLEEKVTSKSTDSVYDFFVKAFEDCGFMIIKKRPIAWLCLAKKDIDGREIDANLVLRPTNPITLTLIMSSSKADEAEMKSLAVHLVEHFYSILIEK